MKSVGLPRAKLLLQSFGLGVVLMLILSALAGLWGEEAAVRTVMWPGVLLSRLSGYGGHDLPGILLYFLGDVLFYWLLAFLFLVWWRPARRKTHHGNGHSSGHADTTTTH
jgi:hypothetical protein